jgi:hypothetical protein
LNTRKASHTYFDTGWDCPRDALAKRHAKSSHKKRNPAEAGLSLGRKYSDRSETEPSRVGASSGCKNITSTPEGGTGRAAPGIHRYRSATLDCPHDCGNGCCSSRALIGQADPGSAVVRWVELDPGALKRPLHRGHHIGVGDRPFGLKVADGEHAYAGRPSKIFRRPAKHFTRGPALRWGHAHNDCIYVINIRHVYVNIP